MLLLAGGETAALRSLIDSGFPRLLGLWTLQQGVNRRQPSRRKSCMYREIAIRLNKHNPGRASSGELTFPALSKQYATEPVDGEDRRADGRARGGHLADQGLDRRLGAAARDDADRGQMVWSTEQEIEAQHYFQPIFDRLRAEPDGTLLSDLVNTVIPEWARKLNDKELHAEMMADTFVGGSETTTNALSAGAHAADRAPGVWEAGRADPSTTCRLLVEEVLRLESPVQGLFPQLRRGRRARRRAASPPGSIINVRFAAANRDEARFADAGRRRPRAGRPPLSTSPSAFGNHHCLGAAARPARAGHRVPGARRARRVDRRSRRGANDFRHQLDFCLRALSSLHRVPGPPTQDVEAMPGRYRGVVATNVRPARVERYELLTGGFSLVMAR